MGKWVGYPIREGAALVETLPNRNGMTFWVPALWLLAMLSEVSCFAEGAVTEQVQHSSTNLQGSGLAGKALFTGVTRFKNKGPACGACHSIASVGFPNGGSLGPDLTGVSGRLGPIGMEAALQTLYFPSMTPIFTTQPLTPEERQDLAAFFAEVQRLRGWI